MAVDLTNTLVIGISSRSLFDLEKENEIFEQEGLEAYQKYQIENEDISPEKGTAYHLIEALLKLNQYSKEGEKLVEVIIMSRNNASIGLRIFNAIGTSRLEIERAAFTSGQSLAGYLAAFKVDLFLSKSIDDVQAAANAGFAAALLQKPPTGYEPDQDTIRIAFDGDAVIFSDESEKIYQKKGLDAFVDHEKENARKELPEGPFAKLLRSIATIQKQFPPEKSPIRIALVTARSAPAHERVIRTLRAWGVQVDEAFFMGGIEKTGVLHAFRAHIFFDDQHAHLDRASALVPSGRVPVQEK